MSRVYDSLKEVVQETLQLGKPNTMVVPRVKGAVAATLTQELEDLERAIGERIGQMKSSLTEGEAAVSGEFEHLGEVIASLKQNIAMLESKLRESEEAMAKKESTAKKNEDNLTARIREIETEISKKEQT